MVSLKKILVSIFILVFILFDFKTVYSNELSSFYSLPKTYKQSLNTSLKGNNYLYPVKIDGLYGFININGKLIVEPKFKSFTSIYDGYYLAYTQDENYVPSDENNKDPINGSYLILPSNRVVKVCDYAVYASFSQNKNYVILHDNSNKQSVNTPIIVASTKDFIFDVNKSKVLDENNGSHSVINVFDSCYITKNDGKYYMTNYSKEYISKGYDSFIGYNDGNFFFKDGNALCFLDENGKQNFQYEDGRIALPFLNNVAPIIDTSGYLKFVDKNKKVLNSYSNAYNIFKKDNIYVANIDGDQVLLDLKGAKILPRDYGGKIQFFYGIDDIITAYDEKTSIFDVFDKDGNISSSYKIPIGYTYPSYVGGYIEMFKNGYGLCSIDGENIQWLIEAKYTFMNYIEPYVFLQIGNSNKGLYDLTLKKLILDTKYKNINVYDKNMIYVESAYFNGYVNSNGQFVYVQYNYDLGNSD